MRFLYDVADKGVKESFEKGREERRRIKAKEAEQSKGLRTRSNEKKQGPVEEMDFKWPAKLKDLFDLDDEYTEYP